MLSLSPSASRTDLGNLVSTSPPVWPSTLAHISVSAAAVYFSVVCVVCWSRRHELLWNFSMMAGVSLAIWCFYIYHPATFDNGAPTSKFCKQTLGVLSWLSGAASSVAILYLFDQKFATCRTEDHVRCQDEAPRVLVINVYLSLTMAITFWGFHGFIILCVIFNKCICLDG
jgi:hypothetical protein